MSTPTRGFEAFESSPARTRNCGLGRPTIEAAGEQFELTDPHLGKVIQPVSRGRGFCICPGRVPYPATASALVCGSLQMTHGRNMAGQRRPLTLHVLSARWDRLPARVARPSSTCEDRLGCCTHRCFAPPRPQCPSLRSSGSSPARRRYGWREGQHLELANRQPHRCRQRPFTPRFRKRRAVPPGLISISTPSPVRRRDGQAGASRAQVILRNPSGPSLPRLVWPWQVEEDS